MTLGDLSVRLARLKVEVPELFDKTQAGTVLYVGACSQSSHHASDLHTVGHELTALEAWGENIAGLKEPPFCQYFAHVVLGDVRQVAELQLPHEMYDFTFWWHGPEHVACEEVAPTVKVLEGLTRKTVVLGSPYGIYRAGATWGNPYNRHLCHLYPQHYVQLGYKVAAIGPRDWFRSCLIAWKCL